LHEKVGETRGGTFEKKEFKKERKKRGEEKVAWPLL